MHDFVGASLNGRRHVVMQTLRDGVLHGQDVMECVGPLQSENSLSG